VGTFELLVDNSALRDVLQRHLLSAGFVSLYQREFDQPLALGNLAVVDVQEDKFTYLKTIYENAGIPIIYTGYRQQNPLYQYWLKRPFERQALLAVCRDAGLDAEEPENMSPGWQCRRLEGDPETSGNAREVHGLWDEVSFPEQGAPALSEVTASTPARHLSGRTGVGNILTVLEDIIQVSKDGSGRLSVASRDLTFTLYLREGIILSADIEGTVGGGILLEVLRTTGAISVYLYRRLRGCIGELGPGLEQWLLENDEIDRATLRQMCQYRLMWCWDRLFDQDELEWSYREVDSSDNREDWLKLPVESLGAVWERRMLMLQKHGGRSVDEEGRRIG
jgi:hypothetical protein